MTQKTTTSRKFATQPGDQHTEDLKWLAEFRNVLSPFWSARVEYHPDKESPVLVLKDIRPQDR